MQSDTVIQSNVSFRVSSDDRSPLIEPETGEGRNISQASPLPHRLYMFLAFVSCVKRYADDRRIFGWILYITVIFCAFVYASLSILVIVYDIRSEKTKQTVTTGLFNAILALFWSANAVYGHHMAYRMLSTRSMMMSLKLHSKTLFKIPANILLSLMALAAVGITNYRAYHWRNELCTRVYLPRWICHSSWIVMNAQAVSLLFYNLLIASAVLSICRTHVIGVRRFLKALENDGKACEAKHRHRFKQMRFSASHNLRDLYLPEDCYESEDSDGVNEFVDLTNEAINMTQSADSHTAPPVQTNFQINAQYDPDTSREREMVALRQNSAEHLILSKDDILFSYWKLASRMRMTSRTLQRWVSSWIGFTILWLLRLIVDWLNHPAGYLEIAQFVLPLLMICILCISYAEANGEAKRVISSITPLQDRLDLLKSLPNIQLGMTLYNAEINYSSIVTVVAALGLALSSRLILDEFLPPSPHS